VNENWGLTEYGFLRPSYYDLLDAFEIKAKELFGSEINLSSRSPLGIFLRIFAWFAGLLWQLAEDVYNSSFIDSATGNSLARLGAFIGIRKLSAQKATGVITIGGDEGGIVPAGFIVQANNGQLFSTLFDALIEEDGTISVAIQANAAGPDGNVSAGSITTVVTPLSFVTEVINLDATIGGRDRETDQEFRERYLQSVDKPGGSNADSIRAQLMEVEGVISAIVWENDTDEVDADGLPPHSIEAIVYGGTSEYIAAAIFKCKAAGIQASGGIIMSLLDASGREKQIGFSRPTAVPVYIRISNLVTNSSFLGNDTIRAAVIAYIGDEDGTISDTGLAIGASVYYNKLHDPINDTAGIIDYTLEVSTDGSTWVKSNIEISARQKAVTSADKVVIV
jgi:uncharacterized phage protein gp47/JayE